MSVAYLSAVGMLGPGLPDWAVGREVLGGKQPYRHGSAPEPQARILPPNERRRGAKSVRWAVAAAQEALEGASISAAEAATVFASSSGDGETLHQMCEALAGPLREVSPTRFHNSVHNAAAGYWSIGAGSRQPSVTLCAHDASFAAGLIEAATQVLVNRTPVLLVENDCVLTVGTDILNAFDRLEVAEYSARSLIDTAVLGQLVPIGDAEIHDLQVAFSLT